MTPHELLLGEVARLLSIIDELQGKVDRLEVEKAALTEPKDQAGSDPSWKAMYPAVIVSPSVVAAGRSRDRGDWR